MEANQSKEVTIFLKAWSGGDREAADRLMMLVYDEMRKLAASYLRQQRSDHTLQLTALVHEAYMKLIDVSQVDWQDRAHFFAVAAQTMRHILVDHARATAADNAAAERKKSRSTKPSVFPTNNKMLICWLWTKPCRNLPNKTNSKAGLSNSDFSAA